MRTLSIVAKDSHTDQHAVGYWGLLVGSGFFAIPGIGRVLVAGPLVDWIVGALEGAPAAGRLSVIGAGLYGIGVPKNSVVKYEMAVKANKFLLMVHGTAPEVERARGIIAVTWPINVTLHSAEVAGAATPRSRYIDGGNFERTGA
jgi:hypothetical protein